VSRSDAVRRIARYLADGAPWYGLLEGDLFLRMDRAPWEGGRETGARDRRDAVRLLPPAVPTKIVCVGLNYGEHIAESATVLPGRAPQSRPDEPLLFLKPPSAVIGSGEAIRYPAGVTRLDPEAEMAVVIGRRATAIEAADAHRHIAGLTCVNDVSARDYQRRDGQWTRAKGFDTFAPLGPWLAMGLDPAALSVECRVNGQVRQSGRTSDLLFPVPFLVSFISRVMTLEPGDVIATGTPAGVAPVVPGDRVEVEVEGVGVLENLVVSASP
jgi:2-keto-4-pentenoate hydratase/2-oxohepta-3-ene-1,7-dioic acid hydratase in catechol pathway